VGGSSSSTSRPIPERVMHELAAAGYALTGQFEFLPRQYGLIFKKRDS
jgi:hypothetical protein